jgi:hypothetical protein
LLTDGLNRMINLQIVYWAICFLIILLYELWNMLQRLI